MSLRDQLLKNPSLTLENNVFYQKGITRGLTFENEYVNLREKEGRIYTDEIVKSLPRIAVEHPLIKEWSSRASSVNKLKRHLKRENPHQYILELGCGNGWLSNTLSVSLDNEICAIDINETELLQGARVFAQQRTLSFLYSDIFTVNFNEQLFNTIILASSVQYFRDINRLMNRLLHLLRPSGEIHILDSPFYSSFSDAEKAKNRSIAYFSSLGFPGMAERYFHHTLGEMNDFNYKLMFNPHSVTAKISRRLLSLTGSAFPWIVIRHA